MLISKFDSNANINQVRSQMQSSSVAVKTSAKRMIGLLALAATVLAVGVAASVESASAITVSNPGAFSANITGGGVDIGSGATKIHVDLTTRGSGSRIQGTIDGSGNVTIPKDNVKLEPQTVPTTLGITIVISFVSAQDAKGTFDPVTGAASLQIAGVFKIAHTLVGSNCAAGSLTAPITLNLSTSGAGGQAYKSATRTFATAGAGIMIPAVTECGSFTEVINSTLHLPYPGGATLKWKLDQTLTGPGGATVGGTGKSGGGGGAGGGSQDDGTFIELGSSSPTLEGKYIRMPVGCTGDEGTTCEGKIRLSGRYKRAALATKSTKYKIAAGEAKTIKLKVGSLRRIKSASRRIGRIPVKIAVSPTGEKRTVFKRSLWL